MKAAGREDGDGREVVGGGACAGGGGREGDIQREPLPLLLPRAASAKQHKERHVVAWTQQEDDLLREQVGMHGMENWTSIAALLKDKTGRQCRRRWYSYLNTECKKGCWSPEEDMILCEAQKIFGNRWTEIAKVFSGRTDNAVKNRFTTLCKKRAKNEAMSKENNCCYPTATKSENFVHRNRCVTAVPSESSSSSLKRIRYQIDSLPENEMNRTSEHKVDVGNRRLPLAVLVSNFDNVGGLQDHQHGANMLEPVTNDASTPNSEPQGSFTRRDDPKPLALMQQLEPLSSLAQRHFSDSGEHSLGNALKELKDYSMQNGDNGPTSNEVSQVDFILVDVEDLTKESGSMENHSSVRQSDLLEHSRLSSQNGNGSISDSDVPADSCVLHAEKSAIQHDKKAQNPAENGAQIEGNASQVAKLLNASLDSTSATIMPPFEELKEKDGTISVLRNTDFSSPHQTMPIFRPFSDGDPSPNFSASERQFLLSALGLSSSPGIDNPSQEPSCKRALLHNL